MEGLISAYRLTSERGERIAQTTKKMRIAWSKPTFLKGLFLNPGPLFLYDRLYLDQRSYESLYNELQDTERKTVKAYVESEKLNIFELINAESVLSEEADVTKVTRGYGELRDDVQFVDAVSAIKSHWGNYARPDPFAFEAMNIPLMELLCEKWSKKLKRDLSVVDDVERSMLFKISKQESFSKMVAPKISKLVIDLVPKYFAVIPHQDNWNIDVIRRIRENKHWKDYRKKVENTAKEATKKFEQHIKKNVLSIELNEEFSSDVVDELRKSLESIQSDIYDELVKTHAELQNRIGMNPWSVLGALVAMTGIKVSPGNPPLGAALGLGGSGMVLLEQVINYFKKKSFGWVEFLEFVSTEMKRGSAI